MLFVAMIQQHGFWLYAPNFPHFIFKGKIPLIISASSLLFGDGAAAMLITHDENAMRGLRINKFYSEVAFKGKKDMSWELSSTGFLMTLSGYVPELIEQDFNKLLCNALENAHINKNDISHWCIHPGGKRILTSIEKSIEITSAMTCKYSYNVLKNYGNMSSPQFYLY